MKEYHDSNLFTNSGGKVLCTVVAYKFEIIFINEIISK